MPVDPIVGGAIAQIGTNVLNQKQQNYNNKFEFSQNMMMYNMQRQDALNDWRMQNEYNSPIAQVERMKAAGLNPHTANGSSIVSTASAQQARGSQAQAAPRAYQVNSGTQGMSTMLALEQIKNIKAQTDKTKAETANTIKDGKTKDLQYMADDKNLLNQSTTNLMNNVAILENREADTALKQQALTNAKQQLQGMLQDFVMKQTESLYQAPFLKGRNDIQSKELSRIESVTRSINQQISQLSEMQPYKVREIQEKIASYKLGNENQSMINFSMPDYLRERNESMRQNRLNRGDEHEAEFDRWLNRYQQITRGYQPFSHDIYDQNSWEEDDNGNWKERNTRTTRRRR